jgi:hypothetical protein
MTIMDKKLDFWDAQSVAGTSAASIAGNTIDLGPAVDWNGTAVNPNKGRGNPIYIHARVGTKIAGDSDATLALFLQDATSTTAASFANLMNMNLAGAASMATGSLTAGKLVFSGAIPNGHKRYLRVKGVVGTATTITAGTVDVWMTDSPLATKME